MKLKFVPLPCIETLAELFEYDVLNGVLLWRTMPGTRAELVGKPVGWINGYGYRIVTHKRQSYRHARLVHMFLSGQDPGTKQVDHINRDRANDVAWNLRLVTPMQNSANRDNRYYPHTGKSCK